MAPPTTTDLALSKPPGYVVSGERQDALTQEMRDRIVKRIYLPGQRLTERELAEEFGVSRSMVRDALNVLAERRLVVRSANRGVEVARIGRAEVIEIYEVREAVEGLLARMASERAPDGTWDDLLDLFGEPATDAVERQDVEAYSVMLDQLSERTVAMAGNSILSDLQLRLNDRIAILSRRALYLPGRMKAGLVGHRAVLSAMAERRPDDAERLKRDNLRAARETLLAFDAFVL